jgi:tetratricopeptide (TPR) repeat protein
MVGAAAGVGLCAMLYSYCHQRLPSRTLAGAGILCILVCLNTRSMRYVIAFFSIFISFASFAQHNKKLYNTWVKDKITYLDGSLLPEDNLLKDVYLKYTFSYPDKINLSLSYQDRGAERSFVINDEYLLIKTPEGGLMNTLKIQEIKDTLILIQGGASGFDDPMALKYYFVPEHIYQQSIPLKVDDIHSIIGNDTTYKESPKIYARYDGTSFLTDIYSGIREKINMTGKTIHFMAIYTVFKSGVADSLKIIQGIDEQFDKRFVKIFNQLKKDWKPAIYNNRAVNVQMRIDLQYSTSQIVLPSYLAGQKGNDAYNAKEYDVALYYYEQALKSNPLDQDVLYKSGMCKMLLGNRSGACEDWNKAKLLSGNAPIDKVLEKYCK